MIPSRNDLWDAYTQNKSNSIRNKIVESYLNLVSREMEKVKTPIGIEKSDIYQFGVLGLIDAVDKCSPDKIDKFESYATIRIRGEIVDQLRHYAKVSQGISRSTLKHIKELEKVKKTLEQEKQEKVSDKEIMEHLDINEEDYLKIQFNSIIYNGVSIDDYYENPSEKKEIRKSENSELMILEEEAKKEIISKLNNLKPEEKYVIENYYLKNRKFNIIADDLKVTGARVSQLHQEAIKKIRTLLNEKE